MNSNTDNDFDSRPLGSYDHRAGTVQIQNGTYESTVIAISKANRTYNDEMLRVMVTVVIEPNFKVVRTMNVAWASDSAWSQFARAAFPGDANVKMYAPREYVGRKVLVRLEWDEKVGFMNITDFTPVPVTTVARPYQPGAQTHATPAPVPVAAPTPVGAPTPVTTAPAGRTQQTRARQPEPVRASSSASNDAPLPPGFPALDTLTPGQRRVVKVATSECHLSWDDVLAIVQNLGAQTLGDLDESGVTRALFDMRRAQVRSA